MSVDHLHREHLTQGAGQFIHGRTQRFAKAPARHLQRRIFAHVVRLGLHLIEQQIHQFIVIAVCAIDVHVTTFAPEGVLNLVVQNADQPGLDR